MDLHGTFDKNSQFSLIPMRKTGESEEWVEPRVGTGMDFRKKQEVKLLQWNSGVFLSDVVNWGFPAFTVPEKTRNKIPERLQPNASTLPSPGVLLRSVPLLTLSLLWLQPGLSCTVAVT